MAISKSTGLLNTVADSGIDAVFNSGALDIYGGARPADANSAATGTLLASLAIPADIFAAAVAGAKSLNAALTGAGGAGAGAGTAATWFRLRQSADNGTVNDGSKPRIDGSVSGTGGGGDLVLTNTSIANTQAITVSTLTVTFS